MLDILHESSLLICVTVRWMTFIANKNCGTFADFRLAQEWVGWVGSQLRKQSISNNFHGRNLGQEASRQCWSVAILDFLTSPFPFEHFWPTEIREITHCYNFLWRWLLPAPGPQSRSPTHLQKPLIGIGAKLFDGGVSWAGDGGAGPRPRPDTAIKSLPSLAPTPTYVTHGVILACSIISYSS